MNIVYVGSFMAVGTLWIFTREMNVDIIRAQTLAFTTIAMFQVFNSFNCRSRTKSVFKLGFFTNKFLFVALVASVSLQVLATQLPFFNLALGTTPLSLWDWLTIVLVSSSVFIAEEMRKLVRNRRKSGGFGSQCSAKERLSANIYM